MSGEARRKPLRVVMLRRLITNELRERYVVLGGSSGRYHSENLDFHNDTPN